METQIRELKNIPKIQIRHVIPDRVGGVAHEHPKHKDVHPPPRPKQTSDRIRQAGVHHMPHFRQTKHRF